MHFLFCVLFAAHLPIPCTAQPEYTLSKLSMQDVQYSVLDIEAGLKTLSAMKTQVSAFRHIVAGHGEIYTSTEQAKRVIKYTIAQLESILDQVRAALANGDARPATDILKCSCAWARCYDYSTTTIRSI